MPAAIIAAAARRAAAKGNSAGRALRRRSCREVAFRWSRLRRMFAVK